ncbi:FAD-dependent monooxygenase [Amycolatopsis coloradensis]|uniref:FAD-dependent monooxygenase n=1 Tax=Amycolatopsis coloradensis TaxID=76021 RepID=A0ACD5BI43_9PSEU
MANGILVRQHDLELLLGEHCAKLGVEIRRGVEVRDLRGIGGDGDVVVETSAGEFTAGWVVAADGGRSVIRKRLGVDFAGTGPELVGYQAIADFEDVSELRRGWNWTPRGIYTYGPVPGRVLVARFAPQPEDKNAPVTLEELQSAVRDVTGIPVTITGLRGRATRWPDNARQARAYRHGRVFLAGDAAHVHSPFSAQGLNLGLGDAVNLGWKLAATIQGHAPAGLLDTYHSERHPIGAWVLDWTRAQVALMRGDERTAQLRKVVGDELFAVPGATNRMVALTSGILQRYDVADDATAPTGSIAGDVAWADASAGHARKLLDIAVQRWAG